MRMSFYEGLTATEAKVLKDYLHGKLTPTVATKFIENMELLRNPSFLDHLAAIAWNLSDSRRQIKIVNPLVTLHLRCGMKKVRH